MRTTSRRFADAIPGVNRWTTVIEWSNDGGVTWQQADLIEGSVTADATSQVRWNCQLSIIDAPFGRHGINPFTTVMRIRHGIAWSMVPTDRELLGMGRYKIMTCSRTRSEPGRINLTGDSFERVLLNARYRRPWKAPAGYADGRLAQMITSQLPKATVYWHPDVTPRWLPATMIERDRWEAIDGGQAAGSIAKALGARIYTNGDGVWVVMPTPSLEDPTSWGADIGPGGILINSSDEYTNEYVYNAVVVTGESTDEEVDPVGPLWVVDSDPYSLTYFWREADHGGFGQKPKYYTSQLITTETQALEAGRGLLASSLGLRQTITFDSLHDPRKEPGDVGLVTGVDGQQERVILDAVTYDLLGGPLQATTRTTQTRLAGDVSEDTGGDGDTEEATEVTEVMA